MQYAQYIYLSILRRYIEVFYAEFSRPFVKSFFIVYELSELCSLLLQMKMEIDFGDSSNYSPPKPDSKLIVVY